MPNLHVHFLNGNVKAFRQELDGTAGGCTPKGGNGGGGGLGPSSASGGNGKSWMMSGMGAGGKADPNERDMFGRTVLHLAASSTTPMAYTFFQILLRHPQLQVNLQDQESGYTALHRALFVGNIRAVRDLLLRNDIDTSIKDAEGMAAYDLYNGTVDGTNPPQDGNGTDLFVWGVNRNFALGTGDHSDKAFPDHINLLTQAQAAGRSDPSQKFSHIGVQDVVMSKLHTGVITSESRGNLSLCGFGANGRLGRSIHSQMALVPMTDLQHSIVSIALGQDHTLALTSGGYILSWGHNRFSQLGYVIEAPEKPAGMGREGDDLIQVSPKRIVGPLKKEFVKGVAAGRMASACWTADAVWTWGTNAGHLGYDKASNPVQTIPRRVTSITQSVIDIAFSDYAMICLLDTSEVICFHGDTNFKISFSVPRLLPEAFPFRPPQTTLKPMITKVTSSTSSFAALSSIGDVFTFTLPNPMEDVQKDGRHVIVKPQIVWALRKNFTAVKDVAIGSDGTVIVCTHSGHVFVRQRSKSGTGQLKFRRIPYLQRVIKVATNESGAFGAIRVDARPTPIKLVGNTLQEDLFLLQPHFHRFQHQMTAEDFENLNLNTKKTDEDEEEDDESTNSVAKDTSIALKMCSILSRWRTGEGDSLFAWSDPLLSSDCHLIIQGLAIPVHSAILSMRAVKIAQLLAGKYTSNILSLGSYGTSPATKVKACHPLVGLLLVQYLYSDDIAAIWDARVARIIQDKYPAEKIPLGDIKSDLKALADELDLSPLSSVLSYAAKQPLPHHTLSSDMQAFFNTIYTVPAGPESPCDVTILLSDRQVSCNSVILRARCPFFEAMFEDRDWTLNRKSEGVVVVRMTHLKWTPMKLVFRWIYEGVEDDLFDYLHQDTLDEFLDFVFEVMAAATELLLDRLVLVCSRAIIRHCNVFNAAALASEASFYQANTLKLSVFDYIISCLETMLESGLLDEMDQNVLQDLSNVIAEKQKKRSPVAREGVLVKELMARHRDWLLVQDIPAPIVRQSFKYRARSALSPADLTSGKPVASRRKAPSSPAVNPSTEVPDKSSAADGIFQMDDDLPTPTISASEVRTPNKGSRSMTPLSLGATPFQPASTSGSSTPAKAPPIWKSKTVEISKADLRSIMAETAAAKTPSKPISMSGVAPTFGSVSATRGGFPLPAPVAGSSKSLLARSPSSAGPSPSGGPWRATEVRKMSFTALQGQQATAGPGTGSAANTLNRSASSQASPAPQRSGSAKVITPVKLQAPSTQPRKSSTPTAAWSTPSTFIPPPPISFSPVAQGLSLLTIQQQEREATEALARKPAKSLREIQEEEQEAERARVQEEEFMRWWHEEEARIAKESGQGQMQAPNGRGRGRGGRGGKARGGGGRGRGRGAGQAAQGARGEDKQGGAAPTATQGQQNQGRGKGVKGHGGRGDRNGPRAVDKV
ncbi:hypothetical protein I314_04326 [Cryptococcus bacillisporus CA1873]|uniref:BTB domain-containing protein n=1 Tax=Cryptococcus bacillisporus CA1873 TaxID=1296111 RepID=A0ABR5B8G6_CRYGA|nr:hypothetical protein I314_04326 [Cryptococcus bacillisporus CA1873]|eukprot:KIR59891.1 hypothetical protein I314_04326 [Cryptococcus gattii CA1873]